MCTLLKLRRAAAGEVSHLLLQVAPLQGSVLQLAPEHAALPAASHLLSCVYQEPCPLTPR